MGIHMNQNKSPHATEPTRASWTRMSSYFSDSPDAGNIDRTAARTLLGVSPEVGYLFRAEQGFAERAVRFLTHHVGVRQIVIAGAGMPDRQAFVPILRSCGLDAPTLVFVEPDVALAARYRTYATTADPDMIHVVDVDPLHAHMLWPTIARDVPLEPAEPVGFLLIGHVSLFPGDREHAAAAVRDHIGYLPAGSFIGLTHLLDPHTPSWRATVQQLGDALRRPPLFGGGCATRTELNAMLAGTQIISSGAEVVEPGFVPCHQWWPSGPPLPVPEIARLDVCALAHIPFHTPAPPHEKEGTADVA